MVGRIGAQLALFAFALCVVAGLAAGNPPGTILTRSLVAMVVVLFAGQLAAYVCKLVLRDSLQARKSQIDLAHRAAVESGGAGAGDAAASPPPPDRSQAAAVPQAPVRAGVKAT